MANETMRIFFPLKIFSYPQYDCSEDEREDILSRDAVSYEDQILAAIAKENRHFENDRGLAEYIHDEALKEKVHSLYPTVEVVDGELWGVMTAGLKETLTGEETAALMDYVCGQNSDGYVLKNNMRRRRPKSRLISTLMVLSSSHMILLFTQALRVFESNPHHHSNRRVWSL